MGCKISGGCTAGLQVRKYQVISDAFETMAENKLVCVLYDCDGLRRTFKRGMQNGGDGKREQSPVHDTRGKYMQSINIHVTVRAFIYIFIYLSIKGEKNRIVYPQDDLMYITAAYCGWESVSPRCIICSPAGVLNV